MRPEFSGEKAQESAFSEALAALKANGSNIIVVGEDDATAHAAVCERLLGADSPRQRLVVRTEADERCGWLPPEDAAGSVRVICHGDAHDHGDATAVDGALLGPLGQAVASDLQDIGAANDGLEPAELRVCLDEVGPLFEDHDPETVFRLVHVLTASVREVQGMGHFHVRADEDDGHVRLLEPLFDAVVSVRVNDGTAEHRWRLPDQDIESQWIEL